MPQFHKDFLHYCPFVQCLYNAGRTCSDQYLRPPLFIPNLRERTAFLLFPSFPVLLCYQKLLGTADPCPLKYTAVTVRDRGVYIAGDLISPLLCYRNSFNIGGKQCGCVLIHSLPAMCYFRLPGVLLHNTSGLRIGAYAIKRLRP